MGIIKKIQNTFKKSNTINNFGRNHFVPDNQVIYFKKGKMYKTSEDCKQNWYDAHYLISDNVLYDLEDTNDIKKIPIPDFEKFPDIMSGYGITGSIDYVLRMKAGKFYNRNEKELCSASLWKSTELMFYSGMGWKKEDYMRIVYWHNELGMFDEAKKAEKYLYAHEIFKKNSFDLSARESLKYINRDLNRFKCDLVSVNDFGSGCCEQCAKTRSRIYSFSGKNKRYPKLPDYAREHGNFHPGCRCSLSLFFLGVDDDIYYKGEKVNIDKVINRPWVDDRDDRERRLYEEFVQHQNRIKKEMNDRKQRSIIKGICRNEYESIIESIPELAPKSLQGYMRMKKTKSKNFMKLYESAKANGIEIILD